MTSLDKKQMKYLRKMAQKEKPIFQMGKLGLTDVFVEQIDLALEKRELIKFNILQNSEEDLAQAAQSIAQAVGAEWLQIIGNTATLYRPSTKEKYQRISQELAHQ
ncbi:ribosome assembly RNA-binding protein YhbY [Vaginisenegalia massiliensis]|uniref:ribosome assembly RNA-binding protein YhbY n=1 Tax=Vaginisenegalia massiliensis TaxID=2058294 RepID=UPI000F5314FA|nr:ribosome assembly RNA-binding protein YhbY [Vaginisenegalia massiliensis]